MSELSSIVNVTITNESPKISQAGFGVPMILGYHTEFPELVRTYSSISEVAADFATSTPEYKKAAAMFAQTPSPTSIKIGRRSATVPQWSIDLAPVNTTEGHVYTWSVAGEAFTYTVQSGDTGADIVDGMVLAMASPTAAVTAVDGSTYLTINADNDGDIFDLVIPTDGSLWLFDDTATDDPLSGGATLADDLTAILAVDSDWYAFCLTTNSTVEINQCTAFADSNDKLFVAMICDYLASTSGYSTDAASVASAASRAHTHVVWHHQPAQHMDAALLGRMLPTNPGSATWEHKTLSGIAAPSLGALSSTQKAALDGKNASYYVTAAGVSVSKNVQMADSEWPDVRRGIDWTGARIQEGVFGLLSSVDKVPYTEAGLALIEAEIRAVLQLGVRRGLYVDGTVEVTMPAVSSISAINKQNRTLPDVTFSAQLAGAVHTTTITGKVYV